MSKQQTTERVVEFTTRTVPEGYAPLHRVLSLAFDQAAYGKGRERHANARPFLEQPILSIGRMLGPGYETGQSMKKQQEAVGMYLRGEADRAKAELLGAIVYAAAAYLLVEEEHAQGRVGAREEKDGSLPNPLGVLREAASGVPSEGSSARRVPRYEHVGDPRARPSHYVPPGTPEDGGHHAAASEAAVRGEEDLAVGDWVEWIDETTREDWVSRLAIVNEVDGNVVSISFYDKKLPQGQLCSRHCVRLSPGPHPGRPAMPSVSDPEASVTNG